MSDPIAEYFNARPVKDFTYRPSSTDWRQRGAFHAFATANKWNQPRRQAEFEGFYETWRRIAESEFPGSSHEDYENLFDDLGIGPAPASIRECKERLRNVHVNIVDLIQYRTDKREGRKATRPQLFRDQRELEDYTNREDKFYPKSNARTQILRELLKVF